MASILVDNGNLVSPQLAPGAKLQYLQDGTITGSAKFTSRLGSAGSGTPIGDPHPFNSNAFCSESEVEYDESTAGISSNYIGVWSSAVQKVTSVSSVAAQQIQQSPNWATAGPDGKLSDFAVFDANGIFVGFPQSAAQTGPPLTNASYTGPDPYRLGGVQSFYQGTTTIRISYSSASSATVIAALAKLSSVLMSLVAGQISYSYSYYAFICTSVTYEETPFGVSGAAQWAITEEYLKLPSPGADPAIYT